MNLATKEEGWLRRMILGDSEDKPRAIAPVLNPITGNLIDIGSLRIGMRGGDVTKLQLRLEDLNLLTAGQVDGKFGKITEAAVKKFQENAGLVVDGIVGPKTLAALNQEIPYAQPVKDAQIIPFPTKSRTPWMDVIADDIAKGVRETPGKDHHPIIVLSHKIAGLPKSMWTDETYWCASYGKGVLVRAGVKPERVGDFHAWARDYIGFGVGCDFVYGAMLIIERGAPGGTSHLTFFVRFQRRDGVDGVICRGGNQSDAVNESWYPLNLVLAKRWPSAEMLRDMGVAA